ncbi:hypothetical protein MKK69_09170 [Methylobacterium sp. J-026]|jgi:hypothetical protein|uniref:hypothetical protein n=1 Tax=unclassified Methylobacterium TaxID=2615210 RepID=UPI0011CC667C|nr:MULTISPECIES: hypothetical protein [unclassified Methylobacterium]MCJ2134222.1 hypothetical protein [Methylobacterium sp. J-026]TXM71189.1 hypothetical protein FV229_00500 [Methylobacterium sp. WL120]
MTLTDSQRDALSALRAAGGEGAIDRHGGVVAAGERLPFLADTWLRLVTLGLVAGAGPLRIRLTAAGEVAVTPRGRKVDPRLLRTDNTPTPAHPGAE